MQAQDVLPDGRDQGTFNGVAVRKGTVGAFLANAQVCLDASAAPQAVAAARRDIRDALPALRALGLFDILQIQDASLRAWVREAEAERETEAGRRQGG
ncbi:hypothetical protein J2732_001061 [Achromobacter deleyi]|uniref:hypothetical protein n=1 Tax=Achromobacter deleyi TaxID=1353891 RepID=UPI00286585C3|nr:hypothetical protein [Achromobacter deleyi]MDR6600078.1 hypothetical protein [Achromobacter deleyi]